MEEEEPKRISVHIPLELYEDAMELVMRNQYLNISDLVRDSIRKTVEDFHKQDK